ncbi:hypothetical protein MAHJHV61_51000 [Mycobacterium avium subsp. hominissuis]|uniref:hypothetical protein n=1 Tax=Mycobacterium avium TaxID=1764 RepID=UPI0015968EB8|nr:hypothetical protein [Mycobacterium avium]
MATYRPGDRVYLASDPNTIGTVVARTDAVGGLITSQDLRGPNPNRDLVAVRWPGYEWNENPEFLRGAPPPRTALSRSQ